VTNCRFRSNLKLHS